MSSDRPPEGDEVIVVAFGNFVGGVNDKTRTFRALKDEPPLTNILSTLGVHLGSRRLVFLDAEKLEVGIVRRISPGDTDESRLVAMAIRDDGSATFRNGLEKLQQQFPVER